MSETMVENSTKKGPKQGGFSPENQEVDPRVQSDENRGLTRYMGLVSDRTPFQRKVNRFVASFEIEDYGHRINLRHAFSYARALKCGGAELRNGRHWPRSRRRAVDVLQRWTGKHRKAIRLTDEQINRVVGFVYDDPAL